MARTENQFSNSSVNQITESKLHNTNSVIVEIHFSLISHAFNNFNENAKNLYTFLMLAFKISFILISISFARPSIALFLSPLFAKES